MVEIKGFLETSFLDWKGKICSVLFLPYCNFRCPYCHNHPLILHPEDYSSIPLEDILNRINSFKGWIDGVCITGGEPTIHKGLPDIIRRIKQQGFLVKLDTNGSNPQMIEFLIEEKLVDFISMDVKAPLNPFNYWRVAGESINLDLILRSIEILKRGKVEYEFRMTVVPKFHSKEDIKTLAYQLKAGPNLILQNFNPENPLDPSLKNVTPYEINILKEIEKEMHDIV